MCQFMTELCKCKDDWMQSGEKIWGTYVRAKRKLFRMHFLLCPYKHVHRTYSWWPLSTDLKGKVFVFIVWGVCLSFLFLILLENQTESPLQICHKQNVYVSELQCTIGFCVCVCWTFSHNTNVGRMKMNVIQMWYFNTVLSLLTLRHACSFHRS